MIDTGTGDTPMGRATPDSILRPRPDRRAGALSLSLQHYKGWEVETNADCFNRAP